MPQLTKRATVYLDPNIHKAVRIRSLETDTSVSKIINDALRHELMDDEQDLKDYKRRVKEPVLSYEVVLAKLKADGKI